VLTADGAVLLLIDLQERLMPVISGGAEVVARPDDTEQAVRKRLESVHRQTLPVATFYKTKSLLRQVDGVGPVDEVFERIEKSLS